jgi:hypothetical protein
VQFMSDRPSIDDILVRQRAERERQEEEQRRAEQAARRHRELVEAFHAVRYCTQQDLPSGTDFFEAFARRLTELVRLLSQRGELTGLLERVRDISEGASEHERDARAFVVHLLCVAVDGQQQEVAQRLREANGLPFMGCVNEWLRRDLAQTFYGHYPVTACVDGVSWPVLQPEEPDPLATLLQACDCVSRAFERTNAESSGGPNPAKVVDGLRRMVIDVAYRIECPVPAPSGTVLDVADALEVVKRVRV